MIKEITASKREREGSKMREREKEWRKETERTKKIRREREKERELFMAITKVSERDAQRTSSVLILSSFPPSLEVSSLPPSHYFSSLSIENTVSPSSSQHKRGGREKRRESGAFFLPLSPFRLYENKMGNEEVDEREVGISCLERNGSHSLSISD